MSTPSKQATEVACNVRKAAGKAVKAARAEDTAETARLTAIKACHKADQAYEATVKAANTLRIADRAAESAIRIAEAAAKAVTKLQG